MKNYDQDMETLTKQQKQQVEKAEASQAIDLKNAGKRIKIEQVRSSWVLQFFFRNIFKLIKLIKKTPDT